MSVEYPFFANITVFSGMRCFGFNLTLVAGNGALTAVENLITHVSFSIFDVITYNMTLFTVVPFCKVPTVRKKTRKRKCFKNKYKRNDYFNRNLNSIFRLYVEFSCSLLFSHQNIRCWLFALEPMSHMRAILLLLLF